MLLTVTFLFGLFFAIFWVFWGFFSGDFCDFSVDDKSGNVGGSRLILVGVMMMLLVRNRAADEPFVEEIETERAEVQRQEDVDGDGDDGRRLRPDGGVGGVGDAHRGEQHETEKDGVGQRHGRQLREEPGAAADVHHDGHQTEQDRPAGSDPVHCDAERRRIVWIEFQGYGILGHCPPPPPLLLLLLLLLAVRFVQIAGGGGGW